MIQNYLHKYCSLWEMSLKRSSWHTKNTERVQRMMGTLWQTAGHLASSSPRHTLPNPTATVPGGVSTVTGRVSVRSSNLPVCATALPSDWPLHAAMETQAEGSMERGAATPSGVCVNVCVLVFPGCPCPHGTSDADVYKNLKTGEVWKMHNRD